MEIMVALVSFIGGALVAFLGYKSTSRVTSGKIATSDATDLWQASQELRNDLNIRINRLDEDIRELRQENMNLRNENLELKGQMFNLKEANIRLQSEIDQVKLENTFLRGRMDTEHAQKNRA